MGRGRPRKDVMDCSVTVHLTLKEKANLVLYMLAKESSSTKSKVLEQVISESPTFKEKLSKLEAEGFL
jgi:hypothetical protein